MHTLNAHNVVDRMVAQLAERRRTSVGRRTAYLALAQAILTDELTDRSALPSAERLPTPFGSSVAA
jgi:hypothetical protein